MLLHGPSIFSLVQSTLDHEAFGVSPICWSQEQQIRSVRKI